jgi:hypothetical protein
MKNVITAQSAKVALSFGQYIAARALASEVPVIDLDNPVMQQIAELATLDFTTEMFEAFCEREHIAVDEEEDE